MTNRCDWCPVLIYVVSWREKIIILYTGVIETRETSREGETQQQPLPLLFMLSSLAAAALGELTGFIFEKPG